MRLAAALLAAALLLAAAPMTNEDVVRLVADGTPEAQVLEAIRSRDAGFDVSEEMLAELRLAGVSEAIVTAMKLRAAPPPAAAIERPPRGTVPLTVGVSPKGTKTLRCPGYADETLKARLHLPKETELRQVKDLAVFLACTTPEHVPDLWRSKTPLGRDMTATERHEMLRFLPGDTPDGKPPSLELPKSLEANLDDAEPHDVVFGVAARIGDRWYTLAVSKPQKVEVAKGPPTLSARVSSRGSFGFEVELKAAAPAAR